MNVLHFLSEYIKHPRTVGAILSSSKQLAKQMISPINFEQAKCIIEYGPGTGVFTEQLIQHKHNDTVLLIIESNKQFYDILQNKYADMKNVYIIHDSAEYTEKYIQQYKITQVDYIVSGLPFTSLSLDTSKKILQVTKELLGEDGKFITFQYTRLKQQFFRSFFTNIEIKKTNWNIPPAFVFTCCM
ncbi:class I SAM-dependent methyltransferase [Bacillus sp. NPDC094106]|uniref:class I SAM-dependent methyltransferase n=1 Tax=Bacillus sp. NPDC094106 TaxID=3363949 RepID=UPI0037FBD355